MEKVEAFKNELRNYNYYMNKLNDINKEIELNFYKKTGVSGISYDKIPCHPSEEAIANFRLSLIEQGDELALERERVIKQITYINNTLDRFDKPMQIILIKLFIKGYTYKRVAKMCNWSEGGLYKYVERQIQKTL